MIARATFLIVIAGVAVHDIGVRLRADSAPRAQIASFATGSVTGRIVDADSGQPLSGVRVAAGEQWTTTDASGAYALRDVPAGQSRIRLDEHYIALSLTAPVVATIVGGQTTAGVDLRVRLEGEVSGRVRDEQGDPVSDVVVLLVTREYSRAGWYGLQDEYGFDLTHFNHAAVVTDDRGAFRIRNLLAGRRHWLLAYRPMQYREPIARTPRDPAARARTVAPAYYPGAPTIESATPIVLHSLERREGVDIVLSAAPAFCVETVLTREGAPSAMPFMLKPLDVERLRTMASSTPPAWAIAGTSGSDGRVRLCDLPPGSFTLTVANGFGMGHPTGFSEAVSFDVSDADVQLPPVIAGPPVDVPVEFVWDRPDQAPDSAAVDVAAVPSSPPGGRAVPVPGRWTLKAARAVPYVLGLNLPSGSYVKEMRRGVSEARFQPVMAGDGAPIQIVLAPDAASLLVRVNRSRPGVSPVWIFALPWSAADEMDFAARMSVLLADDAGAATFTNLPPGDYAVIATTAPPPGVIMAPSGKTRIEKSPETIALLARWRAASDRIELRPRGQRQVVVTAED